MARSTTRSRRVPTPVEHLDPTPSNPSLTDYPLAPAARRPRPTPAAGGRPHPRWPGLRRAGRMAAATGLVGALAATSAAGVATAAEPDEVGSGAPVAATTHRPVATTTGTLDDGATWLLEVPEGWNGTLLLFGHGLVPPGFDNPAQDSTDPLTARALLAAGFALAGSSYATTGWAIEEAQHDQAALIDVVRTTVGEPRRVLAWGASMGGVVSAQLAESPGVVDGALALCGPLAGGPRLLDSYLDAFFALRTLLAPDAGIVLTGSSDPFAEVAKVVAAIDEAKATPAGRARIALAASLAGIPGWIDADEPEPARGDVATRVANQATALEGELALLSLALRADVESRVGGNPSSNVGVDYEAMLRRSPQRGEVVALYRQAEVDLRDDLAALAVEPRIAADPAARAELDRTSSVPGDLAAPVLTLHDVSDPLAVVEHERAYATAVAQHGDRALLRQVFADRAGHCTFTPAEVVTAMGVLVERVERGRWPSTAPWLLDLRAKALGPELNAHLDDVTGAPVPTPPAFTAFHPARFPRA